MALNIPSLSGYEGLDVLPDSRVLRPHVRIGLEFYPQDKDPVRSKRSTKARIVNWDKAKTEATLIGFTWKKQIGQPSGQWTAMIKQDRASSLDLRGGDIIDGDWVEVTVLRNGIPLPLCRGFVDTVREGKTTAGGATVRVWNITGRDHGAAFEHPIAWSNIYIQTIGELTKGLFTDAVKGKIGGTPDEMFRVLVEAAFGKGSDGSKSRSSWALPPALESRLGKEVLFDALSIFAHDTRGGYYNEVNLWTQAGQSLHATLGQWCNPLLNEFWYDLSALPGIHGHRAMEARIRERPFVNTIDVEESPWFGLKQHKVPNWLIDPYDIGRGGYERFTIFSVMADFQFENKQEQAAFANPLYSEGMINRYGVRPFMQSTKYISEGNETQGPWSEEQGRWIRQLADWYGPNPYWLCGTIGTGTVLPEIRVGERLTIDTGNRKTDEHYYVEGTNLNYQFSDAGHRARQGFTLTRGYRGTDSDVLKLVKDVSAQYKGMF